MEIEKQCTVCSKDFTVQMTEQEHAFQLQHAERILTQLIGSEYVPTKEEFVRMGICPECYKRDYSLKQ